jgi:hypothetical protein
LSRGNNQFDGLDPHHWDAAQYLCLRYWRAALRSSSGCVAVLPGVGPSLFLSGALFDLGIDVDMTVPGNLILHFQVWTAAAVTEGRSNSQLRFDSDSCQALTPVDENLVEYYSSYS